MKAIVSKAQVVLFLILYFLFGPQAVAQIAPPSCWPAQIRGTGGYAVIRETATTEGIAWTCGSGAGLTFARNCRVKGQYSWTPPLDGLTSIGSARAMWVANVFETCREPHFIELDRLLIQALRE